MSPFLLIPVVTARIICASVQSPIALGVMFFAKTFPGNPNSGPNLSPPIPSVPGTTGAENFDRSLLQEIKDGKPDISLYLAEKGDYLLFQPIFSYKGYATNARERDEVVVPAGDKVVIVHRNRPAEQEFVAKMQNLHSNFIYQEDSQALALKGTDVLKNNWFFLFVDAMNEMKTPVYGFDALKNFRFNTARPSTKIFIAGVNLSPATSSLNSAVRA